MNLIMKTSSESEQNNPKQFVNSFYYGQENRIQGRILGLGGNVRRALRFRRRGG